MEAEAMEGWVGSDQSEQDVLNAMKGTEQNGRWVGGMGPYKKRGDVQTPSFIIKPRRTKVTIFVEHLEE